MKVKAKFIGTNSLGYKKNSIYEFNIRTYGPGSIGSKTFYINDSVNSDDNGLMDKYEGQACEYSIDSFLKNWKVFDIFSEYNKLDSDGFERDMVYYKEIYNRLIQHTRDSKLEKLGI